MPVDPKVASDPWLMDDYIRRTMLALFDVSVSPDRQERNRHYREGLLALVVGLAHENPFEINDGIQQIGRVYAGFAAPIQKINTHKSGYDPAALVMDIAETESE